MNIKKRNRCYIPYITKYTKPNMDLNAIEQLNSLLYIIILTITSISNKIVFSTKKKTITEEHILASLRLLISGDYFDDIKIKIEEKIQKYNSPTFFENNRQQHAKLVFPPAICEKYMRKHTLFILTKKSFIYCSIAIELIAYLILSLCFSKEKYITIKTLESLIKEDVIKNLLQKCHFKFLGGTIVSPVNELLFEGESSLITLNTIKKYQESSDCLIISKTSFNNLIRSVVAKYAKNIKISKNVFIIMQYVIEQKIIDLLTKSNKLAIHSKRVKLFVSDIELVLDIIH
jgi:histone H3/H4